MDAEYVQQRRQGVKLHARDAVKEGESNSTEGLMKRVLFRTAV